MPLTHPICHVPLPYQPMPQGIGGRAEGWISRGCSKAPLPMRRLQGESIPPCFSLRILLPHFQKSPVKAKVSSAALRRDNRVTRSGVPSPTAPQFWGQNPQGYGMGRHDSSSSTRFIFVPFPVSPDSIFKIAIKAAIIIKISSHRISLVNGTAPSLETEL